MTAGWTGTRDDLTGDPLVLWLDQITGRDRHLVGHKSLNLSRVRRMVAPGRPEITVPDGFVLTTRTTLELLKLADLGVELDRLGALHLGGGLSVGEYSESAMGLLEALSVPNWLRSTISEAYEQLASTSPAGELLLAVRSSAVMEDSVGASFAGQFDSVLGVGTIEELIRGYLAVIASSFSLRALSYRQALSSRADESQGVDVAQVAQVAHVDPSAMSVLVQRMVRSDVGSAGVLMTSVPDPDSSDHSDPVTVIEIVRGTSEAIVGGTVNPESHVVRMSDRSVRRVRGPSPSAVEPILGEVAALTLGEWGQRLEAEFRAPVEVEWACDGHSGELAVVQVRPMASPTSETDSDLGEDPGQLTSGMRHLVSGLAIGTGAVRGQAVVVENPRELLESDALDHLPEGFVLVVATTSPEWVPLMRLASALVTDSGGRGSHAAIVCRELALPAVLGCGNATTALRAEPNQGGPNQEGPNQYESWPGRTVVVDCGDGSRGVVYG